MVRRRHLALGLALALLVAAVVTVSIGYTDRGSQMRRLHAQVSAERAQSARADQEAADEASQLKAARLARQRLQAKYERAQYRIGHPPHGPIPLWTYAALNGFADRFAPSNTSIVAIEPLRATGSIPAQVVVSWQAQPVDFGGLSDAGLLVWQANGAGSRGGNLYKAYRHWHVVYDWHYDGARNSETFGPPGHQQTHLGSLGETFSISVGDVTGDGHPDVLASLNSNGSGGCRLWRLLSSTAMSTTSVWRHDGCDTYVSIVQHDIEIDAAIHGPDCSIHGCGTYRSTLLAWTGERLAVTAVSRRARPRM